MDTCERNYYGNHSIYCQKLGEIVEGAMNLMPLMFYILSGLLVLSALGVVLVTSPIYSALLLAAVMVLLSAMFFMLSAYFLAAVQLIVYAGAVVVLFVMVLMLFDLRKEKNSFSGNWATNLIKLGLSAISAVILLLPVGAFLLSASPKWLSEKAQETKNLSIHLFTKNVLTFELIGVLLLVVLIGSVTLAKSKGGTHAKP